MNGKYDNQYDRLAKILSNCICKAAGDKKEMIEVHIADAMDIYKELTRVGLIVKILRSEFGGVDIAGPSYHDSSFMV